MNRNRTLVTVLALALALAPAALMLTGRAGAQESGADLYMKRCNNCHKADAVGPAKGPDLKGVGARKVAAAPGYAYSEGLKAKGSERWTDANLSAYIADPKAWAPGTKMGLKIADEAQRKAIIAHMKTLK